MSLTTEKSRLTIEQPLPKSKGRWRIALALLAAIAIGAGVVAVPKAQQLLKTQKPASAPVPSAAPVAPETIGAVGRLEPKGEVIKVSGPSTAQNARVEQLRVKEGQRVKANEVIAILDSSDRLRAAVEKAKGEVQVAKAKLAQVKAGAKQGEIEAQKATIARLEAQLRGERDAATATIARLEAQLRGERDVAIAAVARTEAQLRGERDAAIATVARLKAELQGQKETLKATVARIDAQRRNAENDFQRYVKLSKEGAISAQELDNRRLSALTATEQLNESEATRREKIETLQEQVKEAQANLGKTVGTLEQQIKEARAELGKIVGTLQQQIVEAKVNKTKTGATLQEQIGEAKATLNKIAEIRPTDVQAAQAELNSAIAAQKQAEAELALSYVKAPIAGEILKIHTKPGETIGDKRIAEMGRTDQMIVVAEVSETDIGKVRLGQKVTIISQNEAFTGELKGTVAEIGRQIGKQDVLSSDPAADVDARVVEVKIALPIEDSQRVKGLTYANVVVEINSGN